MKKSGWAMFAVLVFLVACGQPTFQEPQQSLLFLRSRSGVALIEPGASRPAFRGDFSTPSRDWSTIVRTNIDGNSTVVTSVDPSTRKDNWTKTVPGRFEAKVISENGEIAALGPIGERSYLVGRKQTHLTIVRAGAAETQSLTLEGNYEPEAFSTDGQSLFVISYLPARAPTKYQVRRLDLNSGAVKGVYTPHEELQEAMGGTARIQQGSPDGKRLYTLYTVGRGDNGYAFIHVLSLDELWAHCIALPKEFAAGPERATALSISPDGERLYVANSAAKVLGEVDTQRLAVARTVPLDLGSGGRTHATSASDSSLYVATGKELTVIDASELAEQERWTVDEQVTGLQESVDGRQLYVGLSKQVAIIDVASGETTETIDPPGIGRISRVGPEGPPLEEEIPKDLECAC